MFMPFMGAKTFVMALLVLGRHAMGASLWTGGLQNFSGEIVEVTQEEITLRLRNGAEKKFSRQGLEIYAGREEQEKFAIFGGVKDPSFEKTDHPPSLRSASRTHLYLGITGGTPGGWNFNGMLTSHRLGLLASGGMFGYEFGAGGILFQRLKDDGSGKLLAATLVRGEFHKTLFGTVDETYWGPSLDGYWNWFVLRLGYAFSEIRRYSEPMSHQESHLLIQVGALFRFDM